MNVFFLALGVLVISMSVISLIAIIDMVNVHKSRVRLTPLTISLLLCIGGMLFGFAISLRGVHVI